MRRASPALAALLPLLLTALAPQSALAARSFTVTASLSAVEVVEGGSAVLSGTVKPARDARVAVQVRTGDAWTTLARRPLRDDGSYRQVVTAGDPGSYDYRVVMPRVGKVRPGRSPVVTLTVVEGDFVDFTIPPGTGAGDWNSETEPVLAEVGQVLRVTNGDSMAHGIATGGAPFPNDPGVVISPGKTVTYELTSAFTGALRCSLHAGSQFFVAITEPAG